MTPQWVHVLYATFALGGVAVYFLMPRVGRSMRTAGLLFGLAALAGTAVLCTNTFLAPTGFSGLFWVSAVIALSAAVKVVTHPKPVYSALYFVVVVLAITPLVIAQAAEFLAVAMVIIYAGAILVTYVFVIMLAQQGGQPAYDRQAREPFVAVFAGFVTMALIAGYTAQLPEGWWLSQSSADSSDVSIMDSEDNTSQVGRAMLTQYVVSLEIAGVLLLVAMVGAIVVSKKRVPADEAAAPRRPPGEIGREVAPF